jgi:hypothetical protein
MTANGKNRKKEWEEFLRYAQDQMSEEERNAFERSLQQDPFAAEALEGLSSIAPEEVRADLAQLQERLHRRTSRAVKTTRNTRTMWYRVAAAVAVLLVVTSVLYTVINSRVGRLDRQVAESPQTEKEEPVPTAPLEPSAALSEEEEIPATEKKETVQSPDEAEDAEKMIVQPSPVVAQAEVPAGQEEISARIEEDELADIQVEREAEIAVQALAVEEKSVPDEAAAPVRAMERQVAAKSRKRAESEHMAGVLGAEPRTVSGVVISGENEQPMQGVIVALKGSNTGTVTDLQGKFEISLQDDSNSILIAQFIGMEMKEVPVRDEDQLLITLVPDDRSLEKVVVIGTGPGRLAHPAGYAVNLAEYDADQAKTAYPGALPVGGSKEFNKYIKDNIQFPESEKSLTSAAVVLSFIVGFDGRPAQLQVLQSPGKAFSDEAMRLLLEGPAWEPAAKNGIYPEQPNRIRIVFRR